MAIWPSNQKLKEREEKFKRLKKRILLALIDYEDFTGHELDLKKLYEKEPEVVEKIIARKYELEFLFDRLDKTSYKWIRSQRSRGAKLRKQTLITSCWAYLISEKGHKLNWEIIVELYSWFLERLKDFRIYNKLWLAKQEDANYLKKQFYKNRKKTTQIFERFRNCCYDHDAIVFLGKLFLFVISKRDLMDKKIIQFFAKANEEYIGALKRFIEGKVDVPLIQKTLPLNAFIYYILQHKKNNRYPKIVFPDLILLY